MQHIVHEFEFVQITACANSHFIGCMLYVTETLAELLPFQSAPCRFQQDSLTTTQQCCNINVHNKSQTNTAQQSHVLSENNSRYLH